MENQESGTEKTGNGMKKWNGGRLNFPKTSRKWKSGIQRMKKMEKWNSENEKNGKVEFK